MSSLHEPGLQIVVAYLMRQEGLSRDDALASVAQHRPIVCPNEGFMRQLQHWQVRTVAASSEILQFSQYTHTRCSMVAGAPCLLGGKLRPCGRGGYFSHKQTLSAHEG